MESDGDEGVHNHRGGNDGDDGGGGDDDYDGDDDVDADDDDNDGSFFFGWNSAVLET